MYAGQLEIRSEPDACFFTATITTTVVAGTARRQEGGTEDGRCRGGSTAADEAPTRRAVGGEAGEEPGIDFVGHGLCLSWISRKRGRVDGGPSRVVEHLLEILGGGNVGGRKYE